MDPYENLANAIIVQACKDYRLTENKAVLKEIENFFHSELFSVLTSLDPDLLITELRKEKRQYDY